MAVVEKMALAKAINESLRTALETDPKVLIMGEDVGKLGGVFRVTDGLQKDFGEDRVIDTPLAESGIVGTAIGLALRGYRPVVEIQFDGFVFPAYDQIVTQLAKMHARALGKIKLPVVIRIPYGGGIGAVEHHSESPEALFAHVAGLKVVSPVERLRRVLDDAAGHRERRPGDLLRAQAPLLGQGRGRHRGHPRPAAQGPGRPRGHRPHARRLRPDGEGLPGGGRRRRRGGQVAGGRGPALDVPDRLRHRPGVGARRPAGWSSSTRRRSSSARARRSPPGSRSGASTTWRPRCCGSAASTPRIRRPAWRRSTCRAWTGCSTPSTARWRTEERVVTTTDETRRASASSRCPTWARGSPRPRSSSGTSSRATRSPTARSCARSRRPRRPSNCPSRTTGWCTSCASPRARRWTSARRSSRWTREPGGGAPPRRRRRRPAPRRPPRRAGGGRAAGPPAGAGRLRRRRVLDQAPPAQAAGRRRPPAGSAAQAAAAPSRPS